jgi:hypothetical protein
MHPGWVGMAPGPRAARTGTAYVGGGSAALITLRDER